MTQQQKTSSATDWVVILAAFIAVAAIGLWIYQQRRGVPLLPDMAAADQPPQPVAQPVKKARPARPTAE